MSTAVNPSSKMDSMTRDELLIHAKKQLILLHKTKAKCDELSSKNVELNTLMTAKDLESNNDRSSSFAETENSAILTRKIKDIQEQLECMQMKEETANATFVCLREEISNLQTENKALKEEVSSLQVARDNSVASLKSLKESHDAQYSQQVAYLKTEYTIVLERNEDLLKNYRGLQVKLDETETEMVTLKEKLVKLTTGNDSDDILNKDAPDYHLFADMTTVSELEAKNMELSQILKCLGTTVANLDVKVCHLESVAKIETSSTFCQTVDKMTADASVQYDVIKCMIDVATDMEDLNTVNKHCEKLEKSKVQDVHLKNSKENDEILTKYKTIILKAKKESADFKKNFEISQRELSAITKLKSSLEDEIRSVTTQLSDEKQKHRLTASSLEQQSSLISLEIADYERHAKDLANKMAEKDVLVGVLQKDIELQLEKIQGLHQQIEHLEKLKQQSEQRSEQLKAASIKLKSELSELKKSDSDWIVRERSLIGQLEAACQDVEVYKMQVADATANELKLQTSNQTMKDVHAKIVKILDGKIVSLTGELELVKSEYDTCRSEFESYKVRVHSVLKQQKSKTTSAVATEAADVGSDEKEHFEKVRKNFETKLQEMGAQYEVLETENKVIHEEHCNLLERHNKLVNNLPVQESFWKQKLEHLQSELRSEQQELAELGRQFRIQKEAHCSAIERLENVHQREVEQLQEKLRLLEAQNLKLVTQKHENEHTVQSELNVKTQSSTPFVGYHREEEQSLDVLNTERQEGEGSEFTDSVFTSSQKFRLSSPTSAFVPLEQLLNQDNRSVSITSAVDVDKLESQLAISSKKIEHMTEILHESEANNARTTEQVIVLKEEIRRLERNQEREKHMANMEYLKNVIVKFLVLASGDERERLVPVLTTLLRLSPEEEHKIVIVAKGVSEVTGAASGWTTYLPLPRWPGTY